MVIKVYDNYYYYCYYSKYLIMVVEMLMKFILGAKIMITFFGLSFCFFYYMKFYAEETVASLNFKRFNLR